VTKVDVVIVNWNSGDLLRRCVSALDSRASGTVRSVVIVDNGSRDDSAQLAPTSVDLVVLPQGKNLGFGRASNVGARRGGAPFILFLNPDTEVSENCVQAAVDYLERHAGEKAAVCGVSLLDRDGALQRHTSPFPSPWTIYRNDLRNQSFDHKDSRDVDHVMGAFYLIKRDVFEALGGFDERFFVYLEDLDLSLRVHQAGYRSHYLADVACLHVGGGVSSQVPARRLFYSMHSRLLYADKHFAPGGRLLVRFVTLFVEPWLRLGRGVVRRSLPELRNTVAAFAMLYAAVLSPKAAQRLTIGRAS
jgi:GT2 family glycosyltransferase